ncbi:MAG: hypothetical protein HOC71_07410 [Candidatus Latescibacteria bacterium]|jgi:hypothetical protein|nr:hypothetical protein [Candidatus Latescibacterota bacterium]
MRNILFYLISGLIISSCASVPQYLRDVDTVADIRTTLKEKNVTCDNAEDILRQYSIDFSIPNPLYENTGQRPRRMTPSHEDVINCRATLLDNFSTEAYILFQCQKDSLEEKSCEEFREKLIEDEVREGMFRVLLTMESGFSLKSLETVYWAMYIENSRGIMIEPADITKTEISTVQDTVFSSYNRIDLPRSVYRRKITLYFKCITFFGEDLFGEKNPYIVFVMSHTQKTVARMAWNISGEETDE